MAHKVLEEFYLNGAVTLVYIDDTVVYGKYEKIFLQMLNMVLDRMTMFFDSEDDKLEVLKAQDEDYEVRLRKGEGVFEKFDNSVVSHLRCDRTYKALKLSGYNWAGMKTN